MTMSNDLKTKKDRAEKISDTVLQLQHALLEYKQAQKKYDTAHQNALDILSAEAFRIKKEKQNVMEK